MCIFLECVVLHALSLQNYEPNWFCVVPWSLLFLKSQCLLGCFFLNHLKLFLQHSTDCISGERQAGTSSFWKGVFQPNKKLGALFSLMISFWWFFSRQLSSCLRQQLFTDLMAESLPASFPVVLLQEAAAVSKTKKKVFHFILMFPEPQRESCWWI